MLVGTRILDRVDDSDGLTIDLRFPKTLRMLSPSMVFRTIFALRLESSLVLGSVSSWYCSRSS